MKRFRLAGTKCNACKQGQKHCDLVHPCFACRLAGTKCRFERQPETRQVPEIIDRLEALTEQIFESGDAEHSSDDDEDDIDNSGTLDPEFGVKRIRLNPLDDPIYTSHPSRQTIGLKFTEIMAQFASPELVSELRERTTSICLEFTQMSYTLHPLEQPAEAKINVDGYIEEVKNALSQDYDKLDSFVRGLLPKAEFQNLGLYSPNSAKLENRALYYAVIMLILSRHLYYGRLNDPHIEHTLQWATINCAKICFRLALFPASIERLRAIVLFFAAGCEHLVNVDIQMNLSRVAMGFCRDLGLNRGYVYYRCSKEQRSQLSMLFWISYFVNRTLSVRWGIVPSVEASEISSVAATLAISTQLLGIDRAIELFRIYDRIQEGLSSASAEERTSRQLMSHSLRLLGKLEKWWQKTYPLVPVSASYSVLDQIDEVYTDDFEARSNTRWTVSTFIYLRLFIYQCCAGSNVETHKTLSAMYPAEVAYLEQHPPRTAHQSRIGALLTPYRGMQKSALQGMIVCTKCITHHCKSVMQLCDGINFLGCLLVATVFTQQLTSDELEIARNLLKAVEAEFLDTPIQLLQELVGYAKTSLRVLEQFGAAFIKNNGPISSEPIPYMELYSQLPPQLAPVADFQGNPMPMRNFVDGSNMAEFF